MKNKLLFFLTFLALFIIIAPSKDHKALAVTYCDNAQGGTKSDYQFYEYRYDYKVTTIGGDAVCSNTSSHPISHDGLNGTCLTNNRSRSCKYGERCGVIVGNKISKMKSDCSGYYYISGMAEDSNCRCNAPKPCTPKTITCGGGRAGDKCGSGWDRGCNKTASCDGCDSGFTCRESNGTPTTRTGHCVKNPPSCNPNSCSDIGAPANGTKNGGAGDPCQKQYNGCNGTITCGGCQTGYSCKGANGKGIGGNCKKDPVPTDPDFTTTVIVFYDRRDATHKTGSETSYSNCYPATNISGSGNASGNVSVVIDGKNTTS